MNNSELTHRSFTTDFLKSDKIEYTFNALRLIHDLTLPEHLDESYYNKHVIPKSDGSSRVLFEPKPVLKEIQHQLLEFFNSILEQVPRGYRQKDRIRKKYLPSSCATAYRKGKNVVTNANFHIGNEALLKADIENFFDSIDVSEMSSMFMDFLYIKSGYLSLIGILDENWSDIEKAKVRLSLAKKIVTVSSLNGGLPQGSPTSGILANFYLAKFDRKFLNYCIRHKLNYSRYSDDLTVSGNQKDLAPGALLHQMNKLLKPLKLRLKKSKTKILRRNKRQVVTGIVLNEKRSAGRLLKRSLRQEIYYLKKFGESHVSKHSSSTKKYLRELSGKVSWVLQVQSADNEFRRYSGELQIISRMVRSGKTLADAASYIQFLENKAKELKGPEPLMVCGLEWRKNDLFYARDLYNLFEREMYAGRVGGNKEEPGLVFTRRGVEKKLYTEEMMLRVVSRLIKWRLPTSEDFADYIRETFYEDRALLGLRVPSDPQYNGIAENHGLCFYNKMGAYWTADMVHVKDPKSSVRAKVGRGVFYVKSRHWSTKNRLDLFGGEWMSKTTGIKPVNAVYYFLDQRFHKNLATNVPIKDRPWVESTQLACSIRLVRTQSIEWEAHHISDKFWQSVSSTRFSSDLSGKHISSVPTTYLKNWNSSSLLLARNKLDQFDLAACPPVKRIDLSGNKLKHFDFSSLPKGLRHLLIDDMDALEGAKLPWDKLFSSLHELTIKNPHDEPQLTDISELYALGFGYSDCVEVTSDEELQALIQNGEKIKFLKVKVLLGSGAISTEGLFGLINQIAPLTVLITFLCLDQGLQQTLDRLKMASGNIQPYMEELEAYLQTVYSTSLEEYNWLHKPLVLNPDQLNSNRIRHLILDLSWFPNIVFNGDFGIKPDLYHILHPGVDSLQLPSTSTEFHRPGILMKILADSYQPVPQEYPFIVTYQPLNRWNKRVAKKHMLTLLPANQNHVSEIVIVVAGKSAKEFQIGRINVNFPRAAHVMFEKEFLFYFTREKYSFTVSRKTFEFPLLGYSRRFDVHKLNFPPESIFRNGRWSSLISDVLEQDSEHESAVHWLDFYSQNMGYFEGGEPNNNVPHKSFNNNFEFAIFPAFKDPDFSRLNSRNLEKFGFPYSVKDGVRFSGVDYRSLSREELLTGLNSGELNPKYLPSKYKKDAELMLAAIRFNSFAFLYAHKGLKGDSDFVIKAMQISLRVLVFLTKDTFKNRLHPNGLLQQIFSILSAKFSPSEYYYAINLLGSNVQAIDNPFLVFAGEQNREEDHSTYASIEKESITYESGKRYGMRQPIRRFLLKEGLKKGLFNTNGYYCSLEEALKNPEDCVFLDLSYKKDLTDLTVLTELKALKILRLSMSQLQCDLPRLEKLEELHADGVKWIWNSMSTSQIIESLPNVKRIYARAVFYDFSDQFNELVLGLENLELFDFRPGYYGNHEEINEMVKSLRAQGRIIDVPTMEGNLELPF